VTVVCGNVRGQSLFVGTVLKVETVRAKDPSFTLLDVRVATAAAARASW
jgi:hypothetical protein